MPQRVRPRRTRTTCHVPTPSTHPPTQTQVDWASRSRTRLKLTVRIGHDEAAGGEVAVEVLRCVVAREWWAGPDSLPTSTGALSPLGNKHKGLVVVEGAAGAQEEQGAAGAARPTAPLPPSVTGAEPSSGDASGKGSATPTCPPGVDSVINRHLLAANVPLSELAAAAAATAVSPGLTGEWEGGAGGSSLKLAERNKGSCSGWQPWGSGAVGRRVPAMAPTLADTAPPLPSHAPTPTQA